MHKPEPLFVIRSISCPDLYVAERAGGWARMGKVDEAMQQTEKWWLANVAPDWEKHFTMEKVC